MAPFPDSDQFSRVFFDAAFAFILGFAFQTALNLSNVWAVVLFVFATAILIDFWRTYRQVDAIFPEITDSFLDIAQGVAGAFLVFYLYALVTDVDVFLVALVYLGFLDLFWCVGAWLFARAESPSDQKLRESMLKSWGLFDLLLIIVFLAQVKVLFAYVPLEISLKVGLAVVTYALLLLIQHEISKRTGTT